MASLPAIPSDVDDKNSNQGEQIPWILPDGVGKSRVAIVAPYRDESEPAKELIGSDAIE